MITEEVCKVAGSLNQIFIGMAESTGGGGRVSTPGALCRTDQYHQNFEGSCQSSATQSEWKAN
jgi:hypothetical protein